MKRAGLRSVLDESALVFRFYRRCELQFEAAVNDTGLYKIDWEPLVVCPSPSPAVPSHSGDGDVSDSSESVMVADAKVENTMSLWHHRLSHCSESLIRQMVADGRIPRHQIDLSHTLPFCHFFFVYVCPMQCAPFTS